jgi:four helix bundle protein
MKTIETNYNNEKDFTSLACWRDARSVKLFFYGKILLSLPTIEKYNLDLQIRKAACSITANIAEGYGRFHYREGLQFYRISRGSLYELKDHLITIYDLTLIDSEIYHQGTRIIEKNKISLNGFINFVKNKI